MYEELVKSLRTTVMLYGAVGQEDLVTTQLMKQAADAIEELLKAAKSMHLWIFLNTGDEQKAYDECGLSDKMNAALGYSGQIVMEPPKEE